MMSRIATGVAIAYALAMVLMLSFLIGVPVTPAKIVFGMAMLVWTSLPVTGLLLRWPHSRTALIIAALVVLFAIYAYVDIMVINSDPQSALGLIIVPIYQLALATAAWGLNLLAHWAFRKAAESRTAARNCDLCDTTIAND